MGGLEEILLRKSCPKKKKKFIFRQVRKLDGNQFSFKKVSSEMVYDMAPT